jgi:hypothetical protein
MLTVQRTSLLLALSRVACTAPTTPPERVAPPVATAAPAATSAIPPPPYPEAWIRQAEAANRALQCRELVYERGCAETRTGSVTVLVTLAADGNVTGVAAVENTIGREPEFADKC